MKSLFRFIFSGLGTILTLGVFLILTYFPSTIGRIEGRAFPVVSEMDVRISESTPISSVLNGSFYINRPGCLFHHIEWRLITPHRQVLAEVVFSEGTKARGEGLTSFGPWTVILQKNQLKNRSLAEVYHQCPGRPWLTITQFYP